MTDPNEEYPPGTRVRFTEGDLIGETGVVQGRRWYGAQELYEIVLDSDGTLVASASGRFERVD